MSYSPNPTWVDGVNSVDAASMNHIEAGIKNASDRLDTYDTNGLPDNVVRTALFGAANRTQKPLFIARVSTSYTLAPNVDSWAQLNWTATKDTDSGFHAGTSATNDYCYYTVPLSRRYDIHFHIQSGSLGNDVALVGEVARNNASPGSSIARDSSEVAPNTELTIDARQTSFALNAGDKIYWASWCHGGSINIGSGLNVDTFIVIRDAGPQ